MRVDGPFVRHTAAPQGKTGQFVLGHHAIRRSHQCFQGPRFGAGEFRGAAADVCQAFQPFQHQRTHLRGGGGHQRRGALHDGLHPQQQLAGVEGLGQVVVGAQFEARDPVAVIAPGCQDEHGYIRLHPEMAQYLETVHVGHLQVQDDQLRQRVAQRLQPFLAALERGRHVPVGAQQLVEHVAQLGVVVDHHHLAVGHHAGRGAHRGSPGSEMLRPPLTAPPEASACCRRDPAGSAAWRVRPR